MTLSCTNYSTASIHDNYARNLSEILNCNRGFLTSLTYNGLGVKKYCCRTSLSQCDIYDRHSNCEAIFITINSLEVFIALFGLVLNSIIIRSYRRQQNARKTLPNLLLAYQATADIVNCLIFAIPQAAHGLYVIFYKEPVAINGDGNIIRSANYAAFMLTSLSSAAIFNVVAFERFLALIVPFFHTANIRKRHIHVSIGVIWFISVDLSLICGYLMYKSLSGRLFSGDLLSILMFLLLGFATLLFFISYLKAFITIRKNEQAGLRKQMKVTVIFVVMYGIFLVGFCPIGIWFGSNSKTVTPIKSLPFLFLTFTSVLNPLLVFWLKKDFRSMFCNKRANKNMTHTKERSTLETKT